MKSGIYRDEWGIPHLRAEDELSLARLQGLVTARDRAWQIESDRWRLEGRLAERIGVAGLEWDRFARRIQLEDTARRCFEALPAADRAWVSAYVDGVNEGLPSGHHSASEFADLDRHFDATRAPAAREWEPWVPLGIFLVAHVLFSTFPHLLWRARVAAALGDAAVELFSSDGGPSSGSNAWVIAGRAGSAGDAPVMAGDPHRLLEIPGTYQQMHLVCPDYDVIGLAFPGVPGLPHFGHTGSAAWGVTNALAHSVDIFAEKLIRDADTVLAEGPGGPQSAGLRTEVIRVRGGEPVHLDCVVTARGPMISEDFSLASYPGRRSELGFTSLRPLLRARSARDVMDALDSWVEPVNRVIAADRSGTMLRRTVGRVTSRPPRARRLPLDPRAVVDSTLQWMTASEASPIDDFWVDANERPGEPQHDHGFTYAAADRAGRIRSLLATQEEQRHPAETRAHAQRLIHADDFSPSAAGLLAWLSRTATDPADSDEATALRRTLDGWDHHFGAASAGAAAFARWRSALVRRITAHPALAPLAAPPEHDTLFAPWFSLESRVADSLPRLLGATELGIDGHAEALAALEEAASVPDASLWGDRHRLQALHLLDAVPGLRDDSRLPEVGLGGDTDCVCATSSGPGVSDACSRGPVARWVWDLGDRSRSRWVVPFGASGLSPSPHFSDQLAVWSRGDTIPVCTDWSTFTREDPA